MVKSIRGIKTKAIILILIIQLILVFANSKVYAKDENTGNTSRPAVVNTEGKGLKDIIDGAKNFESKGHVETILNPGIQEKSMQAISKLIYNIFLVLGIAAAVIMGVVMGIKFITGSVDEKADVKSSLIPYVAGCIVVFGAFAIWGLVLKILQGIPA